MQKTAYNSLDKHDEAITTFSDVTKACESALPFLKGYNVLRTLASETRMDGNPTKASDIDKLANERLLINKSSMEHSLNEKKSPFLPIWMECWATSAMYERALKDTKAAASMLQRALNNLMTTAAFKSQQANILLKRVTAEPEAQKRDEMIEEAMSALGKSKKDYEIASAVLAKWSMMTGINNTSTGAALAEGMISCDKKMSYAKAHQENHYIYH